MKILGKGNNQYCMFVYQYYLFEFNELFSNPCKGVFEYHTVWRKSKQLGSLTV